MKFETYKDLSKAKKWRWRLKSRNGRIRGDSGQGYTRYGRCVALPQLLIENGLRATIVRLS